MALPAAYLTSFKNTEAIFKAIQAAQAPQRFTQRFLEGLGFPNSNDRIVIGLLKCLGFLDDTGVPTKRYHEYLDQSQSALVLADAIREAYADLFRVNRAANTLPQADVRNKMKTLSEGQYTDRVLQQMAGTFTTLTKLGDFSETPGRGQNDEAAEREDDDTGSGGGDQDRGRQDSPRIAGLVYSINLQLPETRDPAVYEALFRSLRQHLLS